SLLPCLWQPARLRPVVVVVLRINLPHGRLTRPLFVRVRDETREPGDQEDRVPQLVLEAEIRADGRDRAVDVDGQVLSEFLLPRIQRLFRGADHSYVFPLELELEGHLEEPSRPRVARVKPVAEAGGRLA